MAGDCGLCHTERVSAMSAPSLADRLGHVAADPALVGHPVVAGLVAVVGELVSLREENAELRRQRGRHSGNRGQPPSPRRGAKYTTCRRPRLGR